MWTNALLYALMALRLTPTRAHGLPPFTIITGSVPTLPSDLPMDPPPDLAEDATDEQELAYVEALFECMEALRTAAAERMSAGDRRVQQALRRRTGAAEAPTTLFHYRPGDLVWRKVKQWEKGGKLAPKTSGIYRVLKVRGVLG